MTLLRRSSRVVDAGAGMVAFGLAVDQGQTSNVCTAYPLECTDPQMWWLWWVCVGRWTAARCRWCS